MLLDNLSEESMMLTYRHFFVMLTKQEQRQCLMWAQPIEHIVQGNHTVAMRVRQQLVSFLFLNSAGRSGSMDEKQLRPGPVLCAQAKRGRQ